MKHSSLSSADPPTPGPDGAKNGEPSLGSGERGVLDLDLLQEPMERLGLGQEANKGRFCGHCYARLGEGKSRKAAALPPHCPICAQSTRAVTAVDRVPHEVLAIYLAKRRREGLIVNLFAFFGIFVAFVLSGLLWLMFPGPGIWREVVSLGALAAGGYYLARLFGLWVGAALGYRSGCALRNRRWRAFLSQRAAQTTV